MLPGEMPLSFAPEALKAQAIAARTFALHNMKTRKAHPFDVFPDVRSQMWTPASSTDPRARMAVNSTSGLVITENYRMIPAYFHSDCGGHTANAKFVFAGSGLTALSGSSCPHAPDSKKWQKTFTRDTLSARLAKAGLANGRLIRLELLDEFKRPLKARRRAYYVRIVTDNGVTRTIPAGTFRRAIGAKSEIKSTMMSAVHNNNSITFTGRGYGHGVGLCQ